MPSNRRFCRRRGVPADEAGMARWPTILLLTLALAGCSRERGQGIVDNDVTYKVPAIKDSVDKGDETSIPKLIDGLSNEDPAVRFYSIVGLRRLTGETFDYHYYDNVPARRPAIARWKAWEAARKP